jgi:hypothetical protein
MSLLLSGTVHSARQRLLFGQTETVWTSLWIGAESVENTLFFRGGIEVSIRPSQIHVQ